MRQQLREWCYEVPAKRGIQRQALAVESVLRLCCAGCCAQCHHLGRPGCGLGDQRALPGLCAPGGLGCLAGHGRLLRHLQASVPATSTAAWYGLAGLDRAALQADQTRWLAVAAHVHAALAAPVAARAVASPAASTGHRSRSCVLRKPTPVRAYGPRSAGGRVVLRSYSLACTCPKEPPPSSVG